MVRVVKEHDERRNELLDIAQKLFCEQGYTKTPISAIIKEAGVAKGTFYHYFKSKDDLIDGLAGRVSEEILKVIDIALAKEELNAIERFNTLCKVSARWKAEHQGMLMVLIKAMYRENNLPLRHRISRRVFDDLAPIFTDIVEQGVKEGLFSTPSPKDAASAILFMAVGMREQTAPLMLQMKDNLEVVERLRTIINFFTDAIERLLGAPKNSIDMGANEFFARFDSFMAAKAEGKEQV